MESILVSYARRILSIVCFFNVSSFVYLFDASVQHEIIINVYNIVNIITQKNFIQSIIFLNHLPFVKFLILFLILDQN